MVEIAKGCQTAGSPLNLKYRLHLPNGAVSRATSNLLRPYSAHELESLLKVGASLAPWSEAPKLMSEIWLQASKLSSKTAGTYPSAPGKA